MATIPTTRELSDKAAISLSYASEIVNEKRDPSRPLAIHIFRRTGWKHPTIAALTAKQISLLESIEPYESARVA